MIIKILVKGDVQGVFFKSNAKTVADNLGLKGTVKNLDNGDVQVFAQGEKEQLQQMIYFCNKGTMTSKIEKVEVEEINDAIVFEDFRVV